jgi:hypothetical protein
MVEERRRDNRRKKTSLHSSCPYLSYSIYGGSPVDIELFVAAVEKIRPERFAQALFLLWVGRKEGWEGETGGGG